MFADVSGFTPMTQALMKEGHEGAEILATVMNNIFDVLVDPVYKWGGFVSVFAGDAFTAIFPMREEVLPANRVVLHVFACVTKVQSIFRRHAIQPTPFGQFALQFKVGLSQGTVHWGIVGKEEKTYFFRGNAISGCVASEKYADKGDIIFDEKLAQLIRTIPHISGSAWNISAVQKGYYRLHEIPKTVIQKLKRPKLPRRKPLNPKVLSRFLANTLLDFKETGEFRHVVPIFIAFEGISTIEELNDWAFVLIKNIIAFGGYLNHLNFGDKGNTVLCGFGAPVAYEKMVGRALGFILSVKQDLKGFQNLRGLKFRAGITYGTAYAGIAGGKKRCVYTYYGEVVNLAARLMMQANWGEILVSQEICDQTTSFTFEHTGDVRYKGFTEPVPTYTVISKKLSSRIVFTEQMIGRRAELQQLQDFAAPIFAGKFAGIAYIYGEAGIGKSHLAYIFHEELMEHHTINWYYCRVDQILRKPFNPFKAFFMCYFEQSSENTDTKNKKRFKKKYRKLTKNCQKIASEAAVECVKELKRTKSVIGAQIGLFWHDSLWEHLDAKGKYENTITAIKNFFLAHSLLAPVVIELEDGHWIDSDSLALLKTLTRKVADYPIFILSTLRYNDDGSKTTFQLEGVREHHIDLGYLSAEEVRDYAENELNGGISNALHALLLEKTNGNPLFVQQLIRYAVEKQVVFLQDHTWQLTSDTPGIPATIHEILIARIDHLAEEIKDIVKAAAVIGREFDIVVLSLILKKDVFSQVQTISEAKIWETVKEVQYGFQFKHALLRDTAYEMQLEARRRELHQLTAETMEKLHPGHLEERYADLAFHYEKAENRDKAIEYLQKAGDEAKAHYHNQQAIELYDRLLSQLQNVFGFTEVEIDTLLKKAEIFELIGEWKTCQVVCEEALKLSEQIDDKRRIGEANRILGIIFRGTGEYDKAMTYFEWAQELFKAMSEQAGIGRTLGDMGMVHDYRSDYEMALGCYEQAFKISEDLGDQLDMAKNANNVGIVYDNKGDYDTAITWYHKSLQICETLGEKLEWSRVLNNIGVCHELQGDYEAAMVYYEQALTISEELGDRLGVAKNAYNMGIVYELKGDYNTAMTWFHKSLQIREGLGYKRGIVAVLNHIGEIRRFQGDYEAAMAYYERALPIAEALGDKLQIGIVLGNIGHVYTATEVYDKAMASYDRAIAIFQEIGSKYFLREYLIGKAEAVCSLQRYEEAQVLTTEGLQIAEELGDKEYIFKSKVLSARIAFSLGNKDAPRRLEEMLQQTEDDMEVATLSYELWKMTHNDEHRQTALTLYHPLYATTPNIEYKTRMEELQGK
jgi:class 3 adenylate cyclase/tetratricopeptide (TPR) repeat protein